VNLGTENKNKVIAVGVLLALAAVITVWQFWPASTTSASVPVAAAHPPQTNTGKKGAQPLSTIDPTLRTDLLKDSEGTKYEGNGKNIFVAGVEQIEKPVAPAIIPQQQTVVQQGPPQPPPPPPIPLRFYGFASQNGGQKKVFLAENDDIFIAAEGDIVDRRYKVIHIYPMAVEIEDVLNNNRQQIPLTQS